MVITIQKNILDTIRGVIVHQCNNRGVMGAGLAKQIRDRYPGAYDAYVSFCQKHGNNAPLGNIVSWGDKNRDLWILNLIAQNGYGRDRQYTDYLALRTCLTSANYFSKKAGLDLYIPYKIGCGLAGGDWKIVEEIINDVTPDAIICRL
jgi:O-acetyl-ADP-ribose deacetylase (regulator of RNase III)